MYLLFDPDNFIHGSSGGGPISGVPHKVASRTCLLDSGAYIFNTEAHPLDAGALDCCRGPTDREVWQDAWFPQPNQESSAQHPPAHPSHRIQPGCQAPSWEDILGGSKFALCPVKNESPNVRKENVAGQSQISNASVLYSLLSCAPAHFVERLCIAGEVCDQQQ